MFYLGSHKVVLFWAAVILNDYNDLASKWDLSHGGTVASLYTGDIIPLRTIAYSNVILMPSATGLY